MKKTLILFGFSLISANFLFGQHGHQDTNAFNASAIAETRYNQMERLLPNCLRLDRSTEEIFSSCVGEDQFQVSQYGEGKSLECYDLLIHSGVDVKLHALRDIDVILKRWNEWGEVGGSVFGEWLFYFLGMSDSEEEKDMKLQLALANSGYALKIQRQLENFFVELIRSRDQMSEADRVSFSHLIFILTQSVCPLENGSGYYNIYEFKFRYVKKAFANALIAVGLSGGDLLMELNPNDFQKIQMERAYESPIVQKAAAVVIMSHVLSQLWSAVPSIAFFSMEDSNLSVQVKNR